MTVVIKYTTYSTGTSYYWYCTGTVLVLPLRTVRTCLFTLFSSPYCTGITELSLQIMRSNSIAIPLVFFPLRHHSSHLYMKKSDDDISARKLLIHWRGEKDAGYSKPFRRLEFQGALEAEIAQTQPRITATFVNALNYNGKECMPNINIEHFNEAMQFVHFSRDGNDHLGEIMVSRAAVVRAVSRCSLVHDLFEVVAQSEELEDLAQIAIRDGGFSDLYKGGNNEDMTWCFRARNYLLVDSVLGSDAAERCTTNPTALGRVKRYSSSARSMALEKKGLRALTSLLVKLRGKVDLLHPSVKIYIFDGIQEYGRSQKVLARRVASGPKVGCNAAYFSICYRWKTRLQTPVFGLWKTSTIAPATRICITNTPLEPIAAFSLCNVARIRDRDSILDPYCGSGTTLLAASMAAPNAQTVGIEIAHNGLVNRDDILKDFDCRGLSPPKKLILGDSTDPDVRKNARATIGGKPFDAIITDPPYGIRESSKNNNRSPLEELFASIITDRDSGHRLLTIGGRLVAFVPVADHETLGELIPSDHITKQAGLRFELSMEQPLNEKLSRWLVSFVCDR